MNAPNANVKVVVTQEQQQTNERIEALQKELDQLRKLPKGISFKLVEFKHKKTGETQVGINIHGITARPMFVYGSQAEKFVDVADQLKQFVEENRSALTWKK